MALHEIKKFRESQCLIAIFIPLGKQILEQLRQKTALGVIRAAIRAMLTIKSSTIKQKEEQCTLPWLYEYSAHRPETMDPGDTNTRAASDTRN
jgi:hypothetical protein